MWPNGLRISKVTFEEDPSVKCIKFQWINKPKGEFERYLFSTGTVVSISDSSLISIYHYNGTVFQVKWASSQDNATEESQDIPLDKMAGGDVYSTYLEDNDGEGDFRNLEHLHFEKRLLKFLSKYILLDWKQFSVVTPEGKSNIYSNEIVPDDNHVIFSYNIFDFQNSSLVHLAEDTLEMKWTDDALNTKFTIESKPMYFVTRLLSDRFLFDMQSNVFAVDQFKAKQLYFEGGDEGKSVVCMNLFLF